MAPAGGAVRASVLLVCMGNICRSPMAEGVLRRQAGEVAGRFELSIDSAGTHSYHVGSPPDPRAQTAALRRGVDISGLRGRQVEAADFERFDFILAMDHDNLEMLLDQAGAQHAAKISLLLDHAPGRRGESVPDPYYGGPGGFERVLDLVEEAAEGFLNELAGTADR